LIFIYSTPDFGPLLSAYLGIILYGIATLSVGLFASSLSSNQIVSAVVGIVILLLLSFLDSLGAMLDGISSTIFNEIALNHHYGDFTKGVIDIRNIVYYLSTASIFLFFTVLILEIRRWR
jgi:ABC-2 type transport system permease protein